MIEKISFCYLGAPDKVADDMVNRICRDNNKPLGSNDPGVKCNQSYLILSPALTPASSQAVLDPDNEEPDIHRDDYHYRSIRDLQVNSIADFFKVLFSNKTGPLYFQSPLFFKFQVP